jgi:HSP20 family protein
MDVSPKGKEEKMAIQRFNDRMDDTPRSFSSMLDRFFNESLNVRRQISDFTPHVDAYETEDSFEIEVALPGMKEEEVNIDFHDGRLTISGERRLQNEDRNKRYHMVESQYGSFSRSFQLPHNTDPENIQADFEDGVLRVSVRKEEERPNRRQIQINSRRNNTGAGNTEGQGTQATDSSNDTPEAKLADTGGGENKTTKAKSKKAKE